MALPTVCDPVELRRFTVDDYHRMAEAGILGRDEHVELLEGIVFQKHIGEPRRYRVDEYYRMAEAGILQPSERVELIDGVIYNMSPIGSRHTGTVNFLETILIQRLGPAALVRTQSPIRLLDLTEPEPDIAVVRPRADFYRGGHPEPSDIFFIIEVMETSAAYDRGLKLAAYAHSGIPEVWLVDLNTDRIEAHRHPVGGVYTESHSRGRGQTVWPEAFPNLLLNVDDILG